MRLWTEITVDEDLLIPVVRELLDMAVNPNQVEVIHGENGRVILVEVHLAEHWYRERLKRDEEVPEEDSRVFTQTEVVAPAEEIPAPVLSPAPTPAPSASAPKHIEPSIVAPAVKPLAPKLVEPSIVVPAAKFLTSPPAPTPVRRVPAPKPSASSNGEDS
jgi:hypothetical protein